MPVSTFNFFHFNISSFQVFCRSKSGDFGVVSLTLNDGIFYKSYVQVIPLGRRLFAWQWRLDMYHWHILHIGGGIGACMHHGRSFVILLVPHCMAITFQASELRLLALGAVGWLRWEHFRPSIPLILKKPRLIPSVHVPVALKPWTPSYSLCKPSIVWIDTQLCSIHVHCSKIAC
jgi:hypothetical protein